MKLTNRILITALAGPAIALGLLSSAAWAGEKWLTSPDEAKAAAQKEGKDILVDFSGSDWCGWCIKLEQEVFSTKEWSATGAKKFVMLLADFPRSKKLPKEQKERNEKLKDEFMVDGFPTVYLLDAGGAPYAKTGYQPGGPVKYLEHLNGLARQKEEKNALNKQIAEAPAEGKPGLLDQLVTKLNQWDVGFWYAGLKEETVKLDEGNKQGLQLKYAFELVYYFRGREDKPKQDYYFGIVKKLSPEKAAQIELDFKIEEIQSKYYGKKDWKGALAEMDTLAKAGYKGESAQKIYYQIALAYNGLKDDKLVRENLQKALDLAPDSELGQEIKRILGQLKEK